MKGGGAAVFCLQKIMTFFLQQILFNGKNPENFCKSGKFLRQVHYWLKIFRKLCNTKYPDNMQSVRMNWKVLGQSKKCPDNLENVSG